MYTPVQLTGWLESIFCRRHGTKTASTSSLSTQSYSFHAPTSSIFFQTCLNIPVFTQVLVFFLLTTWNSFKSSVTLMA